MIENNNPDIDVDDLMSRIQREAARWQSGATPGEPEFSFGGAGDTSSIETWLNDAAAKTEVRTRWSARVDFVVFRSALVQRAFLKALSFIFRDQRHVNLSLIAAMRAFLVVNRDLSERVTTLEHEVHRLGSRLSEYETNPE